MKKMPVVLFVLVVSLGIIYINNVIFDSPKMEEVIEASNSPVDPQHPLKMEGKQERLPAFSAITAPSLSLSLPKNEGETSPFDHSYEEICWNNCDKPSPSHFPTIHSGDVEAGDQLQIDWKTVKPEPTEIHFIQLANGNNEKLKELNREKINPENQQFTIAIDQAMIGNQYALEFIWKDKVSVKGKSRMTFYLK